MTEAPPSATPLLHRSVRRAYWSVRLLSRKGLSFSPPISLIDSIRSPQTTGTPIPQAILAAPAVGAYIAGNSWPTWGPYSAARPDLLAVGRIVSITLSAFARGRCLDVERGGATNSEAAHWFFNFADSSDGLPIFYTSASNVQALINALSAGGIVRDRYFIWSAHYTFVPHVCSFSTCRQAPQCDGTQWTDAVAGGCDGSVMFTYVFLPKPPPPPKGVKVMAIATNGQDFPNTELFLEAQPTGPGETGDVYHIRSDKSTPSNWWEHADGSPKWLKFKSPTS